jgi:NAD(P)-dependent dehydrogenase (short-subunit alcohol dehydrogenase family)
LDNRKVLITGASSGLGRVLTLRVAELGSTLVLSGHVPIRC